MLADDDADLFSSTEEGLKFEFIGLPMMMQDGFRHNVLLFVHRF